MRSTWSLEDIRISTFEPPDVPMALESASMSSMFTQWIGWKSQKHLVRSSLFGKEFEDGAHGKVCKEVLRASLPVELKASGFNSRLSLSYYSEAYSATPVWHELACELTVARSSNG
ncbi:hypothetical protein PGTUg99_034461 [Puccinia graminis f. sp. tritici]|uniref:Uncharacterized protein n=1 Tax=Puccinia graminis f. sp. tritici TaxID=56615 RepID=A0A5B0S1J6_PUCGR|nr:hypothetical protein PGTUg99_034461 [Puccinia graminis f. sp. tritici]